MSSFGQQKPQFLDRLKSIFSSKKGKTSDTAGTNTETPKSSEIKPALPQPANTATNGAPSTADPALPSAGAAPVKSATGA